MADQKESEKERRRYFRVADQLLIGYQRVAEGELKTAVQVTQDVSLLSQLERQVSENLAKVRLSNPVIAETLELFNRKINLVLSVDERSILTDRATEKSRLDVNLSACGIAFPVAEGFEVGNRLRLDITLLPNYIHLSLEAQVIGVVSFNDLVGDDKLLLRADFIDMSEVDQELLVQHVIKCQAQELKARREARYNS